MYTIILLLSSAISDGKVIDRYSPEFYIDGYIEFNTFFDGETQLIIHQWIPYLNSHRIIGWMIKPSILLIEKKEGCYKIVAAHHSTHRKITYYVRSYVETWTNYDPEIIERDIFPLSEREKIYKIKKLDFPKRLTNDYRNIDKYDKLFRGGR